MFIRRLFTPGSLFATVVTIGSCVGDIGGAEGESRVLSSPDDAGIGGSDPNDPQMQDELMVADDPFPLTSGTGPTARTTGITDYWCPRFDSLKSTSSGTLTVGTNQVVTYREHTGSVDLQGADYTLNCVRVLNSSGSNDGGIVECRSSYGCTGGLAENLRIDMTNPGAEYGSAFSSVTDQATWRRVHAELGCDGIKGDGGLFQEVFLEDVHPRTASSGWPLGKGNVAPYCSSDGHSDGQQSLGSEGPIWFYNSRIEGLMQNQTSAMIYGNGPFDDMTFDHNWFQGGNYTIYFTEPWGSLSFTNNVILEDSWNQNISGSEGGAFYGASDFSFGCFEYQNNNYYTGLAQGGPFVPGGPIAPIWGGTSADGSCRDLSPMPFLNITSPALSATSCTEGQAACYNIDISASLKTNYGGGSKRWRFSCGGSPDNTAGAHPQGADLWYNYPDCNGQSSCTMTDVCDMQSEAAGTYTMKVYADAGPGAGIRPSGHAELTFTVR